MASDRQQFARAARRYRALLDRDAVSVPDGHGTAVAILVPWVKPSDSRANARPEDDFAYFEAEGRALEQRVANAGRVPDLRLRASVEDFVDVLRDPQLTSMIICGQGSLSTVDVAAAGASELEGIPSRRKDGSLNWLDFALIANHLKQGMVIQRICGQFRGRINVPLSWGVVTEHRNIWAPVGKVIYPVGLDHQDNQEIRPITDAQYLEYEMIRKQFPSYHGPITRPVFQALPDRAYDAVTHAYNTMSGTTAKRSQTTQ